MSLPLMRPLLCALALLSLSTSMHAREPLRGDLQQQMTTDEFRAAGLDKLSPQELTSLNRWLQGKVETASAAAVEAAREEGRQEVIVKNRGFFDFGSKEPIVATLQGELRSFGKGQVYTLDNGQQWEQTDTTTAPGLRRQSPQVSIRPGLMGVWYLKVDGVNAQPKVRRTK